MPQSSEFVPGEDRSVSDPDQEPTEWIETELATCPLPDQRLRQRLQQLLQQFSSGLGDSLPLACQDWANTNTVHLTIRIRLEKRIRCVTAQGRGRRR
ncbi:MAG: hypothetical protein JOZ45_02730 [Acidobacteriaceae bacterium]|nr:hypothetical protein [Acidobacteriaceae bacterium]